MNRPSGRQSNEMRQMEFIRSYTIYAEGSVLVCFGKTKVICTASIDNSIPRFLKGKGQGWLTAEYGMLPRSTHSRMHRESSKGKQSGRTQEIQRLIGRSLRAAVNLKMLGECQILIDCDVIQADGGTRTAAISGAWVALYDALYHHFNGNEDIIESCLVEQIASVSVGIHQGNTVLDLDYDEDGNAETDMNVVMTASGGFIECQGTAEQGNYSKEQLNEMLALAEKGIADIMQKQNETLQNEVQ